MVNVALLCVQYKPDSRPIMSDVVKMLEGSVENPKPLNPFQPFMDGNFTSHLVQMPLTYITDTSGSSVVVTDSSIVHATPTMRNMPLDKPQVRVDCGPMLLDGIFYT
ncbi:hypothetical protein D0Y65_041081 [Glycine soja]|uniref:Uncharacterized protein n=1 Tax=Glycine soja TaxID=3848 RepID=A0A445GU99_GLYSO|nr:hypothetical protein D0Y65_041081 [Glycine soja]